MDKKKKKIGLLGEIDLMILVVPTILVAVLCFLFMGYPEASTKVLNGVRAFLGGEMGVFYMLLGIGSLVCAMYMAFSKYGKIRLGNLDKPQFPGFKWGMMIFTSTMAADILFYSLCEWALYANESHIEMMGGMQKWAPTYALFHWGPTAWSFYIVLAVAFGFMLHIRGKNKQKFSEACRPILGDKVDGILGKAIDLFAVFALLAGTATTFSLATPLLARALARVFKIPASIALTIIVLLAIAAIYTITVWFGMKAISRLAALCGYIFFLLLAYVFFGGGEGRYIVETGVSSLGNMLQNFISLSTWMDPLRETSFVENWTIFYWAYWLVWCVATPFFIGSISKGRTIKNVVLGGFGWGLAGTYTSFIILGNYSLSQQMKGAIDMAGDIAKGGEVQDSIIQVFETLPVTEVGLILLVVAMVAFYATTFDALTMVVSFYSYKQLTVGKEPDKRIKTFWSLLFILFPIVLIFLGESMASLQSVTIIAALPVGIILILIVASFFKDASKYLKEK
ncbi:BCCT family betaine/carnitine transporter [Aequitasia blattaphilus]|uniref:BCCT family transporter n=1 Tax=Aequitasia blattaphilus TaxID=2949332 RepID=A0ABT1E6A6_9FIRM|nr:BCCT family transporter [Aequitasia blattaphilus]MCP1101367.1 BCCT family transporter [Aequitasia blattaphilus]MCR8614007.1 BCCT family transporter [Aequitasia blattaphilus]